MLRIKNNWCNRLGYDRLEILLKISKEGPSIEEWSLEAEIDIWYNAKVSRVTTAPHNYPKKGKTSKPACENVNTASVTLSDLEDSSEEKSV